jgi:hypothetical protein
MLNGPNPDFGTLVFLIGDRASYARDGASGRQID